jgi:type I restriction enzyme M protein
MSEDQKRQLQTQLWNIANELRGKMNADEFRDYILGFIFYKYLSEKLELYANEILRSDGIEYQKVNEANVEGTKILEAVRHASIDKLGYFLKPSELFHRLAADGAQTKNLTQELEKILNDIQNSTMGADSEDDFDNLFSELDLNATRLGRTVTERNELIAKVLIHLDKIDFHLEDSQIDVLGDAYEYLISQFASGAGKKAGEFYTPQEVSMVLAQLVTAGKKRLKNVYDPTCGSGSLLLRVARYVDKVGHFYGQEMNNTTYNLARMNMILHDVSYDRFNIKQEDTLEHPQHLDQRFEAIVANPPFSAHWSADPIHMSYGRLAPATKADYAFIQHMIYQLDDNGSMAVVMPHGVLFRGGSEGDIRRYLIEDKNYLDAVIGLPANIFFGTAIPTSILVFKKCRTDPDNILFIDASRAYGKAKNQNKLRPSDVEKIVQTFVERKTLDRYSYVASLAEITENDFNLNILRYIDTFEEEEPVDLNQVVKDLRKINANASVTNSKLAEYCKELGIEVPL